ncbi:hypothetical protein GOP47_0000186 [Adiantum capillus-veneris]|uniref:Uncharacterized protein n=1 Tax=Adiantum capillus-veneris TaxID=13818 RepID=A0A9D4VD41_ADICA|nr:hypothetical protein GOP47_0000186 [Adiantum capillus-veneris]
MLTFYSALHHGLLPRPSSYFCTDHGRAFDFAIVAAEAVRQCSLDSCLLNVNKACKHRVDSRKSRVPLLLQAVFSLKP